MNRLSQWLLFVLTALVPFAVQAQEFGSEPLNVEPNWGTTSDSAFVRGAADFHQLYVFTNGFPSLNQTLERFCSGGDCGAVASIQIPTGALITAFAVDACDTSSTHLVDFRLLRRHANGGVTQIGGIGTTGLSATPGCSTFTHILGTPEQVNNNENSYTAEIRGTSSSNANPEAKFGAFRVFYRLRVSPAPNTATYTDVPTNHPFFQFVEALAASGITSGCSISPPQFCPDAPLTRGQMAVFLARALGLHFPN